MNINIFKNWIQKQYKIPEDDNLKSSSKEFLLVKKDFSFMFTTTCQWLWHSDWDASTLNVTLKLEMMTRTSC